MWLKLVFLIGMYFNLCILYACFSRLVSDYLFLKDLNTICNALVLIIKHFYRKKTVEHFLQIINIFYINIGRS